MRTMHCKVATRGLVLALLSVLGAAAAGCGGKDPRPKYSPPNLSSSEAAIVKANNDYWIAEVDGARIDEPGVKILVQPGNTVKIAPGDRTVVVTKSGNSAFIQAGGPSRNYWKFSYPFKAGHTYKVGGGGSMGPGIKITDNQSGTETLVGG